MKAKNIITLLFCFIIAFSAIAQKPVVNFTNNISNGCDVVPVSFTDISTNNPTSWKWYFGNGVTSTLQNPICAYTNPGVYTVKLVATNASGADSTTKTNLITVFKSPTAQYAADKIEGCPPLNISLNDISIPGSSAIVSRQWDFGNGGASSDQNTTATYNTIGSYFISLRVTDANNCTKFSINTDSVKIHASPIASFSSDAQASCSAPFTVNFTNASTGFNGLTYLWDFGDGTTSAATTPSHTYASIGSYNVSLTVNDVTSCTTTSSKPGYINITGLINFKANFSVADTATCSSNAAFTDLSSIGANSWLWRFGDGSTSNQQNPHHSYAASGTYNVTLVARNILSCANKAVDSIQKQVHITIFNPSATDFSMDDSTGCNAPFTVNFTSIAPNAISYQWDFGDGGSSNIANPSHTYNSMGTHPVTLTTTDNHGCTSTKTRNVRMSLPIPDFIANPIKGCTPLNVSFTDVSNANSAITNWSWTFGDGTSSTLQNPSKIYVDTGHFTTSLTITDANGCQNTKTIIDYITPGLKPNTKFFADDTVVCSSKGVYFHNKSAAWAERFQWSFGDGSTSTQEDPMHQYKDTGYFSVRLVTEHHGCYDTLIREKYIYIMPPIALFSGNPISSCSVPLVTKFINTSIGDESYEWRFGDGTINTTDRSPSHTYTSPGLYDVTLIVRANHPQFCTDTLTYRKYIKISLIDAGFTQNSTFSCQNGTINFTDTSTANTPVMQYTWDYGDGQTETRFTPTATHIYNSAGIFNVTLSVLDSLGCTTSITKSQLVTIQQNPTALFTADTTHGCVKLPVNFDPRTSIAYAPAVLASWTWDFGDGTAPITVFNDNPIQHIYQTRSYPGSFTPSLLLTDSKGCSGSINRINYITPTFPWPDITVPSTICFYDSLRVTNNSTGSGMTYLWDFGDGTTSTLASPTHFYNTPETKIYNLSLTVTDSNKCDSTIQKTVKVSRPIAHFYHDPILSNCPPIFVLFHDSSSTDVISRLWDFGDPKDPNNNSNLTDPQHRFNKAGDYSILLTVVNGDGCSDQYLDPKLQIQGPKGTISYGPKQGCAPLLVTFTSQSQDADDYLWIYGNGAAASGQNTIYTYPDSGVFIPIITLTNTITKCSFNVIGTDPITVYPRPLASFNATSSCLNTPITFSDNSTIYQNDQIASWNWNFNDGLTGTGQITSHPYANNGVYDPTLIITTGRGCKDTATLRIDAYSPISNFRFQNACINTPIAFTDSSYSINLSVASWHWDFGDGTTSNSQNPTHTYSSAGNFNVSLTITDSRGCTGVKTKTLTSYPQPIANFSHPPFCPNIAGKFTNLSTDASGISANDWSFGDAITSNLSSPSHAYTSTGNKTVRLITTSGHGCLDTITATIIVNPLPIPNFTTQNTCVGVETYFVNTSTVNPTKIASWTWKSGLGIALNDFDTLKNTYNLSGTFSTKLIVRTDSGCIDSISKNITVFANPIANYNVPPVCITFTNNFTDLSTSTDGVVNKWLWDFGDGTSANTQNTNHIYASDSSYISKLTVTDTRGCIATVTKPAIVYPQPIANFTHSTICQSRNALFTNSSTDNSGITTSSWTFGDGAISNNTSPSHTYANKGNFNIRLIVSSGNTCLDTVTKLVVVNPMPVPNFKVNNPCEQSRSELINLSTIASGAISLWTWHLGDGQTQIGGDTVPHFYQIANTYNPQLIVESDSGCIDTLIKSTIIYPKPVASFSANTPCLKGNSNFTDLSTSLVGTITKRDWDFGDTLTTTLTNPTHKYKYPGDHIVTLQVTNSNGCIDDSIAPVHVNYLPVAQFEIPDTLCERQDFTVNNTSIEPLDSRVNIWVWIFGNAKTSIEKTPTNSYQKNGKYTVKLYAQSITGCEDSISKSIIVLPSPTSLFTATPKITTLVESDIKFTNNSSGGAVRWMWIFADNDTAYTMNPQHTYKDTGTYYVALHAYNQLNCPDVYKLPITINPEFTFYIPNTFTPNTDDKNEVFNGYGICIAEYNLKIFNRWGGMIFESSDKEEGWNGRYFNSGAMSQNGVYTYLFEIVDYKKRQHHYEGVVNLIR